jgi:hypothetical protein
MLRGDEEDDTSNIVPVLVHMDREDWERFKILAGPRKASSRLRKMVKRELEDSKDLTAKAKRFRAARRATR